MIDLNVKLKICRVMLKKLANEKSELAVLLRITIKSSIINSDDSHFKNIVKNFIQVYPELEKDILELLG